MLSIRIGCDNYYHGLILPCLLRPELPPFSYSTESMYNTEYKKKRSAGEEEEEDEK